MKNVKTLLIAIAALFVAFVVGWFSLFKIIQPQNIAEVPDQKNTYFVQTELKLDYGNENVITYQVYLPHPYSAFDALTNVAENNEVDLVTQQYDFGIFVKSIGEYESTADMSWIYFVNGESGMVAADQYSLEAGDVVEWRYITPK